MINFKHFIQKYEIFFGTALASLMILGLLFFMKTMFGFACVFFFIITIFMRING